MLNKNLGFHSAEIFLSEMLKILRVKIIAAKYKSVRTHDIGVSTKRPTIADGLIALIFAETIMFHG
jgi:hypothetical protein